MTDDLSMEALPGSIAQRTRESLAAGVDLILHCNGDPGEMHQVMSEASLMTEDQRTKADAALARRAAVSADIHGLEAEFEALMKGSMPQGAALL